jgi:hypothetical protein
VTEVIVLKGKGESGLFDSLAQGVGCTSRSPIPSGFVVSTYLGKGVACCAVHLAQTCVALIAYSGQPVQVEQRYYAACEYYKEIKHAVGKASALRKSRERTQGNQESRAS